MVDECGIIEPFSHRLPEEVRFGDLPDMLYGWEDALILNYCQS
jgi:hypothetical protein